FAQVQVGRVGRQQEKEQPPLLPAPHAFFDFLSNMNLGVVEHDDRFLADVQREPLEELHHKARIHIPVAGLEDEIAVARDQSETIDLLAARGRYAQLLVLELPGAGYVTQLVDTRLISVEK